jgi:hypothetical protein
MRVSSAPLGSSRSTDATDWSALLLLFVKAFNPESFSVDSKKNMNLHIKFEIERARKGVVSGLLAVG